jgi:ketosteroid isomerase-like protein
MTSSSLDIATQVLQAMTAKDRAATLALFSDDAVIFDPHYPTPLMSGKTAIGDGMDWAFGLLKQPGWTVRRTWENGGSAICDLT